MKATLWKHHGMISVSRILEKTGALKVLVPVTERKNVKGTAVIAYGRRLVSSDGHIVDTLIEYAGPMWEFANQDNQEYAVVIPRYLSMIERQKNAIYRIVELKDKFLWIETDGKQRKVGKPFVSNEFVLLFKDKVST